MKKRISFLLLTLGLAGLSGVASAAGVHGEYQGNPVVSVVSNGKALKTKDVPAILYKDRTMVPIYLLEQLGVKVKWNAAEYSVDVALNSAPGGQIGDSAGLQQTAPSRQGQQPEQNQAQTRDNLLLKDTYEWLSDTNNAILMYEERLVQYADAENPSLYSHAVNEEYQTLQKQVTETLTVALKAYDKINADNKIRDIIKNQQQTLDQVNQTKNIVEVWMNNPANTQMKSSMKLSLLASLKTAQDNVTGTNDIIHQLLLQEMDIDPAVPDTQN